MTTEAKPQKLTNRAIQRIHSTYKSKAEISEALHLIRPYINKSTHKLLSHFLFTEGTGVTQIKITEWCKKAEVSTGSYSKTIKHEIENTFSQPLVITTEAPMKYDKKRKKKVKASPFKSLLPLSVIKHLVRQKKMEEQWQLDEFWDEIENTPIPISENTYTPSQENFNTPFQSDEIYSDLGESDIEGDIKGDIEGDIESNSANLRESKDEGAFSQQQNKSFREKHLDKTIKINNIKSIKEIDSFNQPKKYRIKKEVKTILNQIPGLHDNQIQEFANRIQIAIKRMDIDIKDQEMQKAILDACSTFISNYEKQPENITDDYYGVLYRCIENAIVNEMMSQNEVTFVGELQEEEDYYLDIEDDEHEGKYGYHGEYYQENKQREAYKQYHLAMAETCASKSELDELGIY